MGNVEIPSWLDGLPLAPEYRPTDTEFADPIAYISKIEEEASAFGICKIIPPIPKPSRKYVFYNLNYSLAKCPELGPDVDMSSVCSTSEGGGEVKGVFTTRQQELGQSVRKSRGGGGDGRGSGVGVHKQVWQSGEVYTLEQFESKSKVFAKSVLAGIRGLSPLVVEALFWKAANERPIYIEYANDVPGSAFGEPGCSSRYFHRRRRRKNYSNGVQNCNDVEAKDRIGELGKASAMSSSTLVEGSLQPSRNRSTSTCNEMEGSPGWKLSNSPWNLQVIARSPGSLTRFMPDDIPGVTSPMVYIGMLFSWFAWHVEDHELHSMNFLHTGSQKTWYAVPGDYAFSFEEVIRTRVYGGDTDRLAALKLLGEKTTLLSPEILLASGLPCCRLIQNPGEFVVTFPRAYHVGFSHGFNCGEAANFGTPQWLNIAKEAAVRRAAMSHLPMLSHQQLLYLLTMSFILRVPRSLLPGARSSRLRDRQKVERELLVKRAFIDDILNENCLLSNLLKSDSRYHAVLWHPDLLPSFYKEPLGSDAAASTSRENEFENINGKENIWCDLSIETDLYAQTLNTLYEDDDDDLQDFQTDSGTLPCVACGILGFPFMCVVQPSDSSSTEFLPTESPVSKEVPGILLHTPSVDQLDGVVKDSGLGVRLSENAPSGSDFCPPVEDLTVPSVTNFANYWNTSNRYLRPRIFCLEHALQVEELLLVRGGANMLIICHSDYLKMKAHAMTVSEEIGSPFNYNEISLPSASHEELNLIDLAIENEKHHYLGEDWTAKLDVNLRYCLMVNKESPSKQVNHALALAGLIYSRCPGLDFSTVKWISKRPRSKLKLNCRFTKLTNVNREEEDEKSGRSLEGIIQRKGDKMIKYIRKKHRISSSGCEVANGYPGFLASYMLKRSSPAVCRGSNNQDLEVSGTISPFPVTFASTLVTNENFQKQHESQIAENTNSRSEGIVDHRGWPSNTMPHGDVPMIEACNENSGMVSVHAAAKLCIEMEAQDSVTLNNKVQQETKNVQSSYDGEVITGADRVLKFGHSVPLTGLSEPHTICTSENSCVEENLSNEGQEKHNIENLDELANNCVCAPVLSGPGLGSGVLSGARRKMNMSARNDPHGESKDEIYTVDRCNEETVPAGYVTQENQIDLGVESSEVSSEVLGMPKFSVGSELTTVNEVEKDAQDLQVHFERNGDNASCCEEFMNKLTSASTGQCSDGKLEEGIKENLQNDIGSPQDGKEVENREHTPLDSGSNVGQERKRKKVEQKNKVECNGFVRSPCEGLRPRARKDSSQLDSYKVNQSLVSASKKARKSHSALDHQTEKNEHAKIVYRCDIEGCRMICKTKAELLLHKSNRCTEKVCGKRFNSHKYAMRHQRVHDDERPLKCPWEGCSMSFKWAWARTEHIRVHTGERPYHCKFEGCGRSFRFVSDFSRHRRKTGHIVKPPVR